MQTKQIDSKSLTSIINLIGGCNIDTGPWIAGGTPRRLWYDEPWEGFDVDIFFPNFEAYHAVKLKLEKIKNKSKRFSITDLLFGKAEEASSIKHPITTDNAITFKIELPIEKNTVSIQLIKLNWYDNVKELWDDFDLSVCKFVTDGKSIIADDDAIDGCDNKILRYNKTTIRPLIASRVLKYAKYGFDPDIDIMTKMIEQYQEGKLEISTNGY